MSDDGIDINDYISPEAMAERTEGDEPVAPEAAPAPVDDAPAKDAPAEPVAEPVADTVEPVTEEWQTRYEEAQKLIGRQGQELGDLRKTVEQIQAAQSQPEPEPEYQSPFSSPAPSTQAELLEMAATPGDAEGAYYFALEHAPDMLPDVLAEVQFHDPGLAKRMEIHLYQQMVQQQVAQVQEQVAPVQQSHAQTLAQAQTADAVTQFTNTVENFDAIRDEVAKVIDEEPWIVGDGSPEAVQRGLRAAVKMVNQARDVASTHAQAQATQQSADKRAAAAVETGTAGGAPPVVATDGAKQIHDAIFAQDNIRRELGL